MSVQLRLSGDPGEVTAVLQALAAVCPVRHDRRMYPNRHGHDMRVYAETHHPNHTDQTNDDRELRA